MRIAFAGTPVFAATILRALLRRSKSVVSVLTQPDTQSGRGLKSVPSPVKQVALEHGIAVQQPASLRAPEAVDALVGVQPDLLVVVAYGLILPAAVLALPRHGCINVHASLLPRWRGAAPIQRSIMAGDEQTGICIMQMDAGLDTGPVFTCRSTPIHPDDTAGTLHDRLALLGEEALCTVLDELAAGTARAQPQPADGATYAAKILKADAVIDWTRPAAQLERLFRALDPVPGAQSLLRGQPVKLWRATVIPGGAGRAPGEITDVDPRGIDVACGEGRLRIVELQRAGGRRLPVPAFLQGYKLAPGERFGEA